MTDFAKLVDDHANLWRRVGAHSPWPGTDTSALLAEAREASKQLKAEIARLELATQELKA